MKKRSFLSKLMLMLMTLSLIVACGGNDDNESKTVDGVNVYGGKKIIEMNIWTDYSDIPYSYKIEYDAKGRLTTVLSKDMERRRGDDGIYHYYYVGSSSIITSIDYDLRKLTFMSEEMLFSFNKDGYLDQVGGYTLNYDSNGYLVSCEDSRNNVALSYNNNDLINAEVKSYYKGTMKLYYVTYGSNLDSGDLYILAKRDVKGDYGRDYYNEPDEIGIFILYQSGLLGRVSKSFLNLNDKKESAALFEAEDITKRYSYHISFICQ
jgi:hypothetical protein